MQAANRIDKGVLIDGKYRLEDKLGAGGMGTVWVAEDLQLGRRVALKFPSEEYQRDAAFLERFALEARHASMVRSPHVVQVYGQGATEDGIPYIAMELLDGCDLAAHLAHRGACGLAETGEILEQVCRALQRAHQAGLIHRDIKPQNIFVTPESDGRSFVRVLDFGIAKNLDKKKLSLTRPNVGMGSLLYMSPEQVRDSRSVTPRTDIWALGVVTYELLTGKVPFDGDNPAEFMSRMLSGQFVPASQLQPLLPSAVDALLSRALQPDASLRFSTAEEMSTAFSRIVRLNASGVMMNNGSSSSAPSEVPKPAPARPTLAAAAKSRGGAIVLALALAVPLIAGATLWSREPPASAPPAPPSQPQPIVQAQLGVANLEPEPAKPTATTRELELQEKLDRQAAENAELLRQQRVADDLLRQQQEELRRQQDAHDAEGRARDARKARLEAAKRLGTASSATRSAVTSAIDRANKLEARAFRTLNSAGLNTSHSGKALQNILLGIKRLTTQNEFQASVPVSSKVDSVLVSGDQLSAQVRTTETWETSWYDRANNLCKRHVHQRPIPQTVSLRFDAGRWLIDDIKFDSVAAPTVVRCHE